jgi:hypothetical protein
LSGSIGFSLRGGRARAAGASAVRSLAGGFLPFDFRRGVSFGFSRRGWRGFGAQVKVK